MTIFSNLMRYSKFQIVVVFLICCHPLRSPAAADPLPNFDKRIDQPKASQPATMGVARENAASAIRDRIKQVRIDSDEILGSPKFIASTGEFLTGTNGQGGAVADATAKAFPSNEPHRGVKTFLTEHKALFGFGPEALAAAKVSKDYVSAPGNFRTVVWQQHVDDIPVFNGIFKAHLTKNGELINLGSQFVPDLQLALNKMSNRVATQTSPPIPAHRAIVLAAENIGDVLTTNQIATQDGPQGNEKFQHFRGFPVLNNTSARLTWLPLDSSTLRLCWDINLESRARGELYRVLVDATTGEVWLRHCLTDNLSDIQMNVWTGESPSPMFPLLNSVSSSQPPLVSRTLVTFSALDTNASPGGWINDGNNNTIGNNVDAHLDWDNDNLADPGTSPAGLPNRVFNFAIDLTQAPLTYTNAAVTSLFYWNNWAHDKFYEYGFTEAAGNFQATNFGRGGLGGDSVQADGQDSYALAASGTTRNNANFSTPADGSPPRMQMYIFNGPNPDRDDDLDATMIIHEYTHGVSTRLVGSGAGMNALQSAGMGEGWSDFCALSLLVNSTNDPDANYGMFSYVGYQYSGLTNNYYFGLRRYPCSINTNINPLTYQDIDTNQASAHAGVPINPAFGFNANAANEVHNMGEVWCVTLWEARSRFCHKYGNAAGNQMMLQLVLDGMKLTPANPLFLQARDAILQADRVDNGGANQDLLWASFAKRGMGFSASSPGANSTVGVGQAFNAPADTNAPILAVTSPANGSSIQVLSAISGTAYDGGSGLQGNQIHFTLYNNGNFWSGTYWTNTSSSDPAIDLTAPVVSDAWTFTSVPTGGNQVSGPYFVSAFARDNAGNTSQAQSGVTSTSFTIDTAPPNVAITFPLNGSTLTNQLFGNWFQGTASDTPGNQLSVSLFIRRNSDNLYWTGSGWGDVTNGYISNLYNSGNQTWQSTGSLPTPGSSLANGDYHFIAIAVDAAGNTHQVDAVVSVDFHPVYTFTAGSYFDANPFNDNMSWNNPANWDTGQVPTADVIAAISGFGPDATSLGNFNLYGLNLSGGTLTTVGMTIQKLNLSGGTLIGAINFPSNGAFNWSGGNLNGSCTIPTTVTLNLTGAADKFMAFLSLTNNGRIVWGGSGSLAATYNSVLQNNGAFVIESDAQFYNYTGGLPAPVFNNDGVVQKTNSPGTTLFSSINGGWVFFNNGRPFDIASGVFSIQNPFYVNDGTVFSGAGITRVDASGAIFNGTNTLQPGATFELAGGSVYGTNAFAGTGTFSWTGGTIAAFFTLQSNLTFSISGANNKTFSATATMSTAGTTTWTGSGTINVGYSCVFSNSGSFTALNDSIFYNYTGGLPLPVFINTGTFTKTNGTGTTSFHTDNGGVAFNNNGSVNVQTGVLTLGGGGVDQSATFNIAPAARMDVNGGGHTFGSDLSFTGPGLARLTAGSIYFTGGTNTFGGGAFELFAGAVYGTNTFAGTGAFNWSGGTISAIINLQSNIAFNISDAANKTLAANSTVNTTGNATWTGTGNVNLAYNSALNNFGNFAVLNDAQFYNYTGGLPLPLFVNLGSFTKTNSLGTTTFNSPNGGVAFNNNGSVNVQSGNLALGGGGTATNETFFTAAGSLVDFFSGGFYFNGGATFAGAGTNRISGAGVTFNSNTNTFSGGTLELSSGGISGAGTFSGTGTFNWNGGTVGANLALQSNIAFNIGGASDKTLAANSVLNTAGLATWTGAGNVNAGYNSVITNTGSFVVQNDAQFYNYTGGLPVPLFVNMGSFTKTNSPGATTFNSPNGGVAFNNNGSVNVQSGSLALGGGGTATEETFFTAAGSLVDFFAGGFYFNGNATLSGLGTNRLSGGSCAYNGGTNTLSGGTFEITGGGLGGTATFAGVGNFGWSGGTISAALNLQPNLSASISGPNPKTLAGGNVTVAGNTLWTGVGDVNASYSSSFVNNGVFSAQNDARFYNYTGGLPLPVFINNGLFVKSASASATTFYYPNGGVAFNNNGTINVQTGDLSLSGGTGSNGVYTVAATSHVDMFTGNFALWGNSIFNGAGATRATGAGVGFGGGTNTINGTLEISGGTVSGVGTFGGPGTFNWTSGTIAAVFNLRSNLTFNISVAGDKTLAPLGALNNEGTMNWTGSGNINMGYGSAINNSGAFIAQNDMAFFNYTGGLPAPVFNNTGTFRKTTATGITTFHPSNGGVNFINTGTADLQTGTVLVWAGYATAPSARLQIPIGGPAATTQFGTESFNTPATFAGTLAISLTNNFTPTNGQSFVLANYGSYSGQFATTQLPPLPVESKWNLVYGASTLVLQVVPSAYFQTFVVTNGNFFLSFTGQTGTMCVIEGSTNLFNWEPLLTNAPFNGNVDFVDTQSAQYPQRFYRARIFP